MDNSHDTDKPLVSIIMPACNEERYLPACMDSILNQTFHRFELVVVDDRSVDRTLDILHAYTQRFEEKGIRLKIIESDSKGLIEALYLAYENTEAQYLSRMDADDIMPPHKIETLYNKAIQHPEACITGFVEYFSDGTLGAGYTRYAKWLNDLTRNNTHYQSIYKECVVASPCWMIHRSTITKMDAFREDNSCYPEDYDLVFKLYEFQVPIIGIPEVLHLWRDHPTRASRTDDNYADQGFLYLKVSYFFDLDRQPDKPLYIWGAGKAGKNVAKEIMAEEVHEKFLWVSNNPKKVGHDIYGKIIQDQSVLESIRNAQIIVAIKERNFIEDNRELIESIQEHNRIFFFY